MELITFEDLKKMKENDEKVFVDFFSTTCAPCKILANIIESIMDNHTNVKFVKIDIKTCMDQVFEMGINSVPTVVGYNGNQEVFRSVGLRHKLYYSDLLNSL